MYTRDMKFNYSVRMRGAPPRDILDNLCSAAAKSKTIPQFLQIRISLTIVKESSWLLKYQCPSASPGIILSVILTTAYN